MAMSAPCYMNTNGMNFILNQTHLSTFVLLMLGMLLQVLYYVADNQLSAKLETAIQALDNITKTYYSFVNAEPRSSSQPITPARRYDAHLVPYDVLQQTQPALRSCYDGVSENVAGLIEHILALKATLNDVYERNTVNQTIFELNCRSFVYRTQQVGLPYLTGVLFVWRWEIYHDHHRQHHHHLHHHSITSTTTS